MRSSPTLDVLGIGAALVDQIVHISEGDLAIIPGKKGGMEVVDNSMFLTLRHFMHTRSHLIPGGSCANVLRGLARLGRKCALIGKLGSDEIGDAFLSDLNSHSIQSFCLKSTTPTGQVLSFVTPDGQRTCRTYLGAYLEMKAEDLNSDAFHNVKIVHIEGYSLLYPGLTERAMEYAKNAGALISLDLASFEIVSTFKKMLLELLPNYVDLCFSNEDEIRILTGANAKEGCLLLNDLCSLAVVSMGKNGCWVSQHHTSIHYPAYPIEFPLDSTGAGDLFASGFLHGFLGGKSLEVCAHYGALAGAATVQVEGTCLSEEQWKELRQQMIE